jgi:REP-associated tyrosine transposase
MKQAHEYRRDEHRVHLIIYHLIIYHLIWCPRRRKSVLVGPVGARCRELIESKCAERTGEILALAIQPDHLQLVVRVTPSDSAAEVVKECKGVTSFSLRREFPSLLRLPSMGTRSYFASTAGNVSQQTIQRYRAAQTGRYPGDTQEIPRRYPGDTQEIRGVGNEFAQTLHVQAEADS